jgi:toxin HigB-1
VDIIFSSKKLEALCHDDELATRTLGAPCARRLRSRLDDLLTASCLAVARSLPGRFHPLKGDRSGQFAFHLQGGCRLVIEPVHTTSSARADGSRDLERVTAVRVVLVGDYHD